jgi:hypothetical protein
MQWILDHWEFLSIVVINVLGIAAAVVKLTPSTTDDEWVAKIESVVKTLLANKPTTPPAA